MFYRGCDGGLGGLFEGPGGHIPQHRYHISFLYCDGLTNYVSGTLRAFLSGRISHFMKWGGPSVVVDTACSSSIVAIYQACRALQNGDCNAALAGGVNVVCSPDVRWSLCSNGGDFIYPLLCSTLSA